MLTSRRARTAQYLLSALAVILFGTLPIKLFALTTESNTAQIFNTQQFQLKNKIPVIAYQRGDNDLFSIQLVVDVGLQDVSCENRHLPHVVEHVLFEETKSFSGPELRRRVYDKGGYWQGYTTDEYTHYTIHIHKLFSDIAVDTLHRLVSEPTLSDAATANAIRTVNTEMGTSANGDLQNWLNDTLSISEQGKNRLYPETNLACEKRQTPNHLTAQQVKKLFEQHYVTSNFTIIVIGQFDTETLSRQLNSTFGELTIKQAFPRTEIAETEIDYTPILETEKYGDPSTYLRFFVRADGKSEESRHAWKLISLYLTEKLFEEIRTKRGIGYSPTVVYNAGTNIGHLEASVRTTSDWYKETESIALSIYDDLINKGIPEEDITRLKLRMRYIFESQERENIHLFQLYRHNRQQIFEQGTMSNQIEEIQNLSISDIQNVIDRMPPQPLIAVLRPNSFMEAVLKVIGIVAIAALVALPILRRNRNKKAHT